MRKIYNIYIAPLFNLAHRTRFSTAALSFGTAFLPLSRQIGKLEGKAALHNS